jgi:hypothetical protein
LAISVVSITGVHAPVDGEDQLQLAQIRFDRRLHVRILQLTGKLGTIMGAGAMHLPSEAAAAGDVSKLANFSASRGRAPRHAALDEGPAHGGASLCSFISSAAYSGGRASGWWPSVGPPS